MRCVRGRRFGSRAASFRVDRLPGNRVLTLASIRTLRHRSGFLARVVARVPGCAGHGPLQQRARHVHERIALRRGALRAAIDHADREWLDPFPILLSNLHWEAHVVEGQPQMPQPDFTRRLVDRKRIVALTHARLATCRGEVMRTAAGLHSIVGRTPHGGEEALAIGWKQCAQGGSRRGAHDDAARVSARLSLPPPRISAVMETARAETPSRRIHRPSVPHRRPRNRRGRIDKGWHSGSIQAPDWHRISISLGPPRFLEQRSGRPDMTSRKHANRRDLRIALDQRDGRSLVLRSGHRDARP